MARLRFTAPAGPGPRDRGVNLDRTINPSPFSAPRSPRFCFLVAMQDHYDLAVSLVGSDLTCVCFTLGGVLPRCRPG